MGKWEPWKPRGTDAIPARYSKNHRWPNSTLKVGHFTDQLWGVSKIVGSRAETAQRGSPDWPGMGIWTMAAGATPVQIGEVVPGLTTAPYGPGYSGAVLPLQGRRTAADVLVMNPDSRWELERHGVESVTKFRHPICRG